MTASEPAKEPLGTALPSSGPPSRAAVVVLGLAVCVAALELALHLSQASMPSPEGDLARASAFVRKEVTPKDLIVFSPSWVDPLGRAAFGDLITMERAGWSDLTRYPRVFEVSLGGKDGAPFKELQTTRREQFGSIEVRVRENRSYETIIDDLLPRVAFAPGAPRLDVSRLDVGNHESMCAFRTDRASGGPWDPATPPASYDCSGGRLGAIATIDLEYRPRYCIAAEGFGGAHALRLRFRDVRFGKYIAGHHFGRMVSGAPYGIHTTGEKFNAPPVSAVYSVDEILPGGNGALRERELGRVEHRDGESWLPFRVETGPIAGEKGDLIVDLRAPGSPNRTYCFEATTR